MSTNDDGSVSGFNGRYLWFQQPMNLTELAQKIIEAVRKLKKCFTGDMSFEDGVELCDLIKRYLCAARYGEYDEGVAGSKECGPRCFADLYGKHAKFIQDFCNGEADPDVLFNKAITTGSPLEAAIEGFYVLSQSLSGNRVPGGLVGAVVGGKPGTIDDRCPCWSKHQRPKPR